MSAGRRPFSMIIAAHDRTQLISLSNGPLSMLSCMRVIFLRSCYDQAAVLPTVNIPAAPVGFMGRAVVR